MNKSKHKYEVRTFLDGFKVWLRDGKRHRGRYLPAVVVLGGWKEGEPMTVWIGMTGWMCHRELSLDLTTPVAFVVGRNGAGKTAIRDALEFVYIGTGKLRGIGTKKELAELSIREGAAECEVTIATDRMRVRRAMNRSGEQRLWRAVRTSAAEEFQADERVAISGDGVLSGAHEDVIRVALDANAFYRLDATRRRELLIEATKSAPDDGAAVLEAIREEMPEALRMDPAVETFAARAAETSFAAAEAAAVENRKAAKREAAATKIELPDPTFDGIDLSAHPLEQFEAHLGTLRGELQAQEMRSAVDLATLRGQLAEAEASHARVQQQKVGRPDPDAIRELATEEADLATHRTRLHDLDTRIADLRAAIVRRRGFETPKTCPAVTMVAMPCPVQPEVFEKAIAGEDLVQKREMLEADRVDVARNHDAVADRVEALRERAAKERARVATERGREDLLGRLDQRIRELRAQIASAEAMPPADGPTADELRLRVARGERIVAQKRSYDAALEKHREDDKKRAQAEAAVLLYDALAHALAPEGAATKLGGSARDAFHAVLDQTVGFAGEIRVDEDFGVRVRLAGAALPALSGQRDRHPLQLSHSERLAVGMAIQHAFASRIHFPVLVCDELDTFDGPRRGEWFDFATGQNDTYFAVLGLATLGSDEPSEPPEGTSTYWIQPGGKVVRLGETSV